MNPWYKNKLFIAAVVILVLGGIYFAVHHDNGDRDDSQVLETEAGEILVTGKITCLELAIAPAEADQDCVKGIKGNDGKTYAINSTDIGMVEWNKNEGDNVTAVGKFEPANTSTEEGTAFKYDGVLVIRGLK